MTGVQTCALPIYQKCRFLGTSQGQEGAGWPSGVSKCHIRPRNFRKGSGTRVCVSWDRTEEGCGEGKTKGQRGDVIHPGSLSQQVAALGLNGESHTQAPAPPASRARSALSTQVSVFHQPQGRRELPRNVKLQASPGNNWQPGRGLYSGSQNIWPQIG